MKKLFIIPILICLLAVSSSAMNPAFLSMIGAGSWCDAHYLHCDTWNGSTDAEDNWDSAAGTDADMDVSANGISGTDAARYNAANGNTSWVVKDLGSEGEVYGEIEVKFSAEGGWGVSKALRFVYGYDNAASPQFYIEVMSDAGQNIRGFLYGYWDDVGFNQVTDFDAALVPGTFYTIKFRRKISTGVDAGDGIWQTWRDGVAKANVTNIDDDTKNGTQDVNVGCIWKDITAHALFIYYDDWWVDDEDR